MPVQAWRDGECAYAASMHQTGILICGQVRCGFERTTVGDSPLHGSHFRGTHHDIMKTFAVIPITLASHCPPFSIICKSATRHMIDTSWHCPTPGTEGGESQTVFTYTCPRSSYGGVSRCIGQEMDQHTHLDIPVDAREDSNSNLRVATVRESLQLSERISLSWRQRVDVHESLEETKMVRRKSVESSRPCS